MKDILGYLIHITHNIPRNVLNNIFSFLHIEFFHILSISFAHYVYGYYPKIYLVSLCTDELPVKMYVI